MGRFSTVILHVTVGAILLAPQPSFPQETSQANEIVVPESILRLRLPNAAGKSILSPTGWGAAYNTIFGGMGYQTDAYPGGGSDADWSFGAGIGDPVKLIGAQGHGTIYDISGFSQISLGGKLHRYLGRGTSVAAGAMTLIENVDDQNLGRSFFIVVSHTLQTVDGTRPGVGRVHLSLGAGSGQFASMPLATRASLGTTGGTWFFGNAAVELAENWNAIAEWDGLAMNLGMSYSLPLPGFYPAITMGIADITKNVGDRPRFVFGAGSALRVF